MIVDFLKQWGILHWQIAQTPYHHVTLLPGTPSACHSIVKTSYQLVTLFPQTPYCLDTLSHSSYLTHTLSHSHPISLTLCHSHPISLTLSHPYPICESPYRPGAQELTEGMLELERSRIETATELEQLHDQKDNLQEHLSVLKHTLVVVTLSHACTCRHASSCLCFCLFLKICRTFKR